MLHQIASNRSPFKKKHEGPSKPCDLISPPVYPNRTFQLAVARRSTARWPALYVLIIINNVEIERCANIALVTPSWNMYNTNYKNRKVRYFIMFKYYFTRCITWLVYVIRSIRRGSLSIGFVIVTHFDFVNLSFLFITHLLTATALMFTTMMMELRCQCHDHSIKTQFTNFDSLLQPTQINALKITDKLTNSLPANTT